VTQASTGTWHEGTEFRLYAAVAAATTIGHAAVPALPFGVGAIVNGFGLTDAQAGMLTMFELVPYALTQIVLTPYGPRLSPRAVSIAGTLLVLCASIASALAPSLTAFVLARIVAGIGFGMAFATGIYAGAWARQPERAYAIGLTTASVTYVVLIYGLGRGADVRALLFPSLPQQAGVFAIVAVFAAILLPFLWLLPSRARSMDVTRHVPMQSLPRLRSLACLLVMALFAIAVFGTYVFIERRSHAIGMSPEAVGTMLSVCFGLGIASTAAAAVIARRFGLVLPLSIGLVVEGLSCLAITTASTPGWLWGAVALNFLAWNFLYPYLFGLGAAIDPLGRLSTAVGAVYLLGSAAAAGVGGFLLSLFGSYSAVGFVSLLLTVIGAVLAAFTARNVLPNEAS
jgi:predicted MFS family arabinose efflux permease